MRAGPFSARSAESPLIADPSRSLLMSATSTGRGSQRLPAGRGCPKEIVQGETVRNFVCEPVDEITRQWDRVARLKRLALPGRYLIDHRVGYRRHQIREMLIPSSSRTCA